MRHCRGYKKSMTACFIHGSSTFIKIRGGCHCFHQRKVSRASVWIFYLQPLAAPPCFSNHHFLFISGRGGGGGYVVREDRWGKQDDVLCSGMWFWTERCTEWMWCLQCVLGERRVACLAKGKNSGLWTLLSYCCCIPAATHTCHTQLHTQVHKEQKEPCCHPPVNKFVLDAVSTRGGTGGKGGLRWLAWCFFAPLYLGPIAAADRFCLTCAVASLYSLIIEQSRHKIRFSASNEAAWSHLAPTRTYLLWWFYSFVFAIFSSSVSLPTVHALKILPPQEPWLWGDGFSHRATLPPVGCTRESPIRLSLTQQWYVCWIHTYPLCSHRHIVVADHGPCLPTYYNTGIILTPLHLQQDKHNPVSGRRYHWGRQNAHAPSQQIAIMVAWIYILQYDCRGPALSSCWLPSL